MEALQLTQVAALQLTQVEALQLTQVEALQLTQVEALQLTQVEALQLTQLLNVRNNVGNNKCMLFYSGCANRADKQITTSNPTRVCTITTADN